MLNIGYHESTANGLEGLGLEALEVGANTFAFFTRNPRGRLQRRRDRRCLHPEEP